jgi:putative DNA primase/helicase
MNKNITITTVDPIYNILDRLDLVKETGNGRWRTKCPSHSSDSSRKRTLSVGIGESGAVLLNCFAGCSAEQVAKAVGLELMDLFPRDEYIQNHNHRPRKDYRAIMNNAQYAATFVEVGARALLRGEQMSPDDKKMLAEAANHLRELIHV